MKLLLIESQSNVVLGLYRALHASYEIECLSTGSAALRKLQDNHYDVIVLASALTDMNGLKICEWISNQQLRTPLLILGNNPSTQQKVLFLDSGADDYLAKPFEREELEARLRVLCRNKYPVRQTHSRIVIEDLIMDTAQHFVTRNGIPVALRLKEFHLLECLMQNAGRVVSSQLLSSYAWEEDFGTLTNNLHVHINHLRDKIDKPFNKPLIRTIHGVGYKIENTNTTALETCV